MTPRHPLWLFLSDKAPLSGWEDAAQSLQKYRFSVEKPVRMGSAAPARPLKGLFVDSGSGSVQVLPC